MAGDFRKRSIVTGASRGIGEAIARALAARGNTVTVNCLKSRERAEKLAQELGGRAYIGDVGDPEAARELVDSQSGAGILVLNAGISKIGLFQDMTPEEWREIFRVNVDGAYNVLRPAIPYMVREQFGRIVIISSMWGIRGASCEAAYSATKAALIGLTRSLARELGPSGITVNCLCPGVIATDMNSALTPETLAELIDETPAGRLGTPEDVANAAVFLTEEKAGFITGQVLSVDGGFTV